MFVSEGGIGRNKCIELKELVKFKLLEMWKSPPKTNSLFNYHKNAFSIFITIAADFSCGSN